MQAINTRLVTTVDDPFFEPELSREIQHRRRRSRKSIEGDHRPSDPFFFMREAKIEHELSRLGFGFAEVC